jgi:uncharacterized protein (TIGR00369 family)
MDKEAYRKGWLDAVRSIGQQTAREYLDIEIVDADEDHVVLTMPITDKVRQPYGLLHGGFSMVLAETAASLHATYGVDLTEKGPVGIEINGSHLRSAREGTVRAQGRVVRRSRSIIVHQVDIYHQETGALLCTSRVTNYYKKMNAQEALGV